jgi:hypothetical protein
MEFHFGGRIPGKRQVVEGNARGKIVGAERRQGIELDNDVIRFIGNSIWIPIFRITP